MTTPVTELRESWLSYKAQNPRSHPRDFAHLNNVSECDVIAASPHAIRLKPEWQGLMRRVCDMGYIKTMTRNDNAVLERHGTADNLEFVGNHVGQTVGGPIELRMFIGSWAFAYALAEEGANGLRKSIMFFDRHGTSIFKAFEEPQSNAGVYEELVAEFRDDDQSAPVVTQYQPKEERPDSEIDVKGFLDAWDNMKDTHDFFGILRKYGVTRFQANRIGGVERSTPLDPNVAELFLNDAARTQRRIMIFVSSAGMAQIHIGTINKVVRARGWLNVLDPEFNLHLQDKSVATAWWVRKPTVHGVVNAIELYDSKGDTIALFFSKREENSPESPDWREFLSTLPTLNA